MKTTLLEGYLTGRQACRKTRSQEDDLTGRQPHRKTNSQEAPACFRFQSFVSFCFSYSLKILSQILTAFTCFTKLPNISSHLIVSISLTILDRNEQLSKWSKFSSELGSLHNITFVWCCAIPQSEQQLFFPGVQLVTS